MLISTLAAAMLLSAGQTVLDVAPLSPPTPAAAPAATAADPQTPAPAPQPRVVCHTETVVGSRMPSRICMTTLEQETRTRDSRALAQRLEVQNANRGRVTAGGRANTE